MPLTMLPPARLGSLLRAAGLAAPPGLDEGRTVSGVVHDSRRAGPGSLFVAVRGFHVDGHRFVADALARGAAAAVVEAGEELGLPPGAPVVAVPDTRAALAALAAAAEGHPSRDLTVAGVTGTDGKTTVTTMLWSCWRGAGLAAGSVTTVDVRSGDEVKPNPSRQTTPEAVEVQRLLGQMRDEGCSHVALETSSHALELRRVDAVDFRAAVYTRVTSEHLELHGTRERYLEAKALLLEAVSPRPDGVAVLDLDDGFAYPRLSAIPIARRLTYSAAGDGRADLTAGGVEVSPAGISFGVGTPWGGGRAHLRLPGRFNVANALAALAAACATGASLERALAGLETLTRVPGRMERVDLGQPFEVVVDYAHTAEALATVLAELRPATAGRLWAVFGSAGERDREKRAAMGEVAARGADVVVLTDEDPREEDRLAILEEIEAGAQRAGRRRGDDLLVIPDREEAIRLAVGRAGPGDTVLLAGKGHERSILSGRDALPWDERAMAEAAVRSRGDAGRAGPGGGGSGRASRSP